MGFERRDAAGCLLMGVMQFQYAGRPDGKVDISGVPFGNLSNNTFRRRVDRVKGLAASGQHPSDADETQGVYAEFRPSWPCEPPEAKELSDLGGDDMCPHLYGRESFRTPISSRAEVTNSSCLPWIER